MAYELAESLEQLDNYLSRAKSFSEDGFVGMDTEASGFDTRRAKIAGLSLSYQPGSGIYVPLGHTVGSNLPKESVARVLEENGLGVKGGLEPVFYNAKYDLNILQANLKWYPKRFQDAIEVVYLEDPDRKGKDLKSVALEDLGFDMARFESLFTPEEVKSKILIINHKLPSRCVDYAVGDAEAALRLWRAKKATRDEQKFAVQIDTQLIEIVRRMEFNGGMVLNLGYIEEQIETLGRRAEAMEEQVYRAAGFKFAINSPKQLGDALFERMGIPSPGMTKGKNPQHKTGAEDLEKLAHQYPVIKLITAYRSVVKARSTYFMKLQKLADLKRPVRFIFNMFAAPTFRFSSPGGSPEKDGGCGINIQAVSNGEAVDMMAVDLSGEDDALGTDLVKELGEDELLVALGSDELDVAPDGTLVDAKGLPWTVENEDFPPKLMCFRETCAGCPAGCKGKGVDTTRRLQKNLKLVPSVRQAFAAKEGYTLVSFDYDRQELVIGANMSKEPNWLRALARGEDLHEVTASLAFGIPLADFRAMKDDPNRKEEYKRKRGIGKILNFATFYGATAYTLARKADIPQVHAEKIYNDFKNGLRTLFNWIEKVHLFARKEGYTTTYFGRKRTLKQFYRLPNGQPTDRKIQAFGDRSSVNTAIQGTAAEVTRIAMVRVDDRLKKAIRPNGTSGYDKNEVRLVMQLHDELTFMIRDDLLTEAIPIIKEGMEFKVKSWEVQLTVGFKIGKVWGRQEGYVIFEGKLVSEKELKKLRKVAA